MKILVRDKDSRPIRIYLPTRLLFNGLTAEIGARILTKHVTLPEGVSLSPAQVRRLVHTLNRCKRRHGPLKLVEVESADGSEVLIQL